MNIEKLFVTKDLSGSKHFLCGFCKSPNDAGRLRVFEGCFASLRYAKRIDFASSRAV